MKSKYLKYAVAAVVFTGLCAAKADDVLSAAKQAEINAALNGVSVSEAVKSSAALVSSAVEAQRMPVTVYVLRTVAHSHVASLPKVVAAIARSTPDMADVAASEAARLHPEEAVSIVRSAVQIAPGQAGAIVESVLFYAPSAFREVGETAIDAAPAQSRAVLTAVSVNNLDLKPYFDNALASGSVSSPSAAKDVLRHATLISKGVAKHLSTDLMGAQVVQNNSQYGYAKPLNVAGSANASGSSISSGSPTFLPPTVKPPVVVIPPTAPHTDPSQGGTAPVGGGRGEQAP